MAWTMPAPPDQLIQLLRRRSPMAPAGAVPPPGDAPAMAFGSQPTPQTVAQNQQQEGQSAGMPPSPPSTTTPRAGVPVYSAQPGGRPLQPSTVDSQPSPPAAPPSDDPSISPVKTPELGNYMNPFLQQQIALNARRAAVPAVDPNQVKPKLWERLVGIALGATQLRNPENAGAVADSVVNRRLYGAERARNLALQPINEEQDALNKSLPAYTASGRAAYEQADLNLRTAGENRQRSKDKNDFAYKGELNDIRTQRDKDLVTAAADRNQTAQDRLAERERNDQQNRTLQDRVTSLQEQALKDKEGNFGGGNLAGLTEAQNRQWRVLRETLQPQIAMARADHMHALQISDMEGAKSSSDEVKRLTKVMTQKLDKIKPGLSSDLGLTDETPPPVTMNQRRGGYSGSPEEPSVPQTESERVNELGDRKVGDIGVVRGQRVRITAIYKNGKFDYEPATGAQ